MPARTDLTGLHHHEEPRDFFRYSPYGLRHLVQGFEPGRVLSLTRAVTRATLRVDQD